jgi:hypothetical protein
MRTCFASTLTTVTARIHCSEGRHISYSPDDPHRAGLTQAFAFAPRRLRLLAQA